MQFYAMQCEFAVNSHLENFREPVDVNKEQGKYFYQDIKIIKEQYQGQWDSLSLFNLVGKELNVSHYFFLY